MRCPCAVPFIKDFCRLLLDPFIAEIANCEHRSAVNAFSEDLLQDFVDHLRRHLVFGHDRNRSRWSAPPRRSSDPPSFTLLWVTIMSYINLVKSYNKKKYLYKRFPFFTSLNKLKLLNYKLPPC